MHFFTPQRLGRFKGFAIQIFRSVCSSDSVLLSTCGFGDWALGLGMHCSLQLWVSKAGTGIGIARTDFNQRTDGHAGFGIGDLGLGLGELMSASIRTGMRDLGSGMWDWDWVS